ncbi:MAG: glycosyltransferase [Lentimicrobiaceae bacterium]|jgi:GT2 family glycosyltransferase|nr:glycosyltransferase [Lentimicrobiaceae bacterium]
MKKPNFSIIILYHTGKSYLKVCLESVLKTIEDNDEVIVVVNNCDYKEHEVDFFNDKIQYLHYYENLGHGKAANLGVAHAKNDYVIISDHDLVFFPKWIDYLWQFYNSDRDIKALSCKIIDVRNNSIQNFVTASAEYNFAHPYRGLPIYHPLVMNDRCAQMICTGGFLIGKSDFLSIGGFNENFGTIYTDFDLCLRLKKQGKKVGVAANAIAYHFGGDWAKEGKSYKSQHLKTDIKGAIMKDNADIIENDLSMYYKESFDFFIKQNSLEENYFVCNCMTVVNPSWYEELLKEFGLNIYGSVKYPILSRDVSYVDLFDVLGYNIMALRVPVAYFVDSFPSIIENAYWWQKRKNKDDIVIDRNANILLVKDIINNYK